MAVQLLITQSKPFFRHLAIKFINNGIPYVIHNSRLIGHPVMEKLDVFMSDRKLIKSIDVDLSDAEVIRFYEHNKNKVYNLVSYNCEHFTNQALGKIGSPQVKQYLFGLTIFAILLYSKKN